MWASELKERKTHPEFVCHAQREYGLNRTKGSKGLRSWMFSSWVGSLFVGCIALWMSGLQFLNANPHWWLSQHLLDLQLQTVAMSLSPLIVLFPLFVNWVAPGFIGSLLYGKSSCDYTQLYIEGIPSLISMCILYWVCFSGKTLIHSMDRHNCFSKKKVDTNRAH